VAPSRGRQEIMTDRNNTTAEAFAAALRARRSIDLYEPVPVDTTALLDAIEVARWAPNHRLTEPWRFYLVGPTTAAAIIELAAEIDAAKKGPRAGDARRERLKAIPGFFVLTSKRSDDALTDREDYAASCCSAQNLMLYLWQRGIGVKWTTGGVTRDPRFYELLAIDPSKETVVGFFFYGVPKVVPEQKRKPVDEIVTRRP
jgi:nitroreductase